MNTGVPTNMFDRALRLGELVDHLGPRTVTALGSLDTNAVVLATEFYDALDELPEQSGVLLIVPSGALLDLAELQRLAAEAAKLRYAALALKATEENVPTLTAIAETSGLPILRVVERVGWRLFEALVGGLLGEQRSNDETRVDGAAEPLFALANELASYFGGSVAIEDLGRRIVAYSSVPGQLIDSLRTRGILARRVPESPFNDDQYRSVIRSEHPIKYLQLDGELPRIACAIRAGALPLGTIWVIDPTGEEPMTPERAARVERAAGIAAGYMLDDIRVREAGQAPREALMRTLLSGSAVVGSELAELGIAEERGAVLLAFDPGSDAHPTTVAQIRSTVQRHLALHRPETVTAVRRGRVYSLISHEERGDLAQVVEPLVPLLDRLVGAGRSEGIRIALPGRAHRVGEVAVLRERADWLFGTAARLPPPEQERVLTVAGLRPQLLLSRVRELFADEAVLVDPRLQELAHEHPSSAEALLHWCESFGNVTRAAAAAGVHENTIRYRVRRAEERYGLATADPDSLLAMWLQLRANSGGGELGNTWGSAVVDA